MSHKRVFVNLIVVAVIFSPSQLVWAIGTTPPSWQPRELIGSVINEYAFGQNEGGDRLMAYDHHGNPAVAYFDAGNGDLRYARRVPGIGWASTAIDTGGNVGSYPSVAFDRYERPAVSYRDTSNGDLKYAHFDGATWQVESPDTSLNDVGAFTSLAFDLLGRPAVAYKDDTDTSLKFVRDSNGDGSLLGETPVPVSNVSNEGQYATLAFDRLNRPMIVHLDSTLFDLRFSVEEPGLGWITTTVDSAGAVGYWPSIAIEPDTGFPAIAYSDLTNHRLRYAQWTGSAWIIATADTLAPDPINASLAFDPADGNPAIAYHDAANSALKLAWHDGTSWQTQIVDNVGDVGRTPSLAFNDFGSGFPSISYFERLSNGFDANLFFIEDPPAAVPEPGTLVLLAMCVAAGWSRRRETAM